MDKGVADPLPKHTKLQRERDEYLAQYIADQLKLREVRDDVKMCSRCDLRAHCGARGSPHAGYTGAGNPLLLVTGHPEPHEVDPDRELSEGTRLLYRILHELGVVNLMADRTNFIFQGQGVSTVSAVRCLPPGLETHKIRQKHIQACLPWLGRQIAIIKPKVIVGLGTVAMSALSGVPLTQCKVIRGIGTLLKAPIPNTFLAFTVSPEYVIHRRHAAEGQSRSWLKQVLSLAWQACRPVTTTED